MASGAGPVGDAHTSVFRFLPRPMKIFRVGGAVRDELLGLPVKDHDYVVVGATPEQMTDLGFRAVGKDFPVFLHPQTQEEYALARTERKSGRGYKGFVVQADPDVSLEEDLARRDLTINAMARADDGALIDPFDGEKDLRAGILRHVSPAFIEDPVRILRVARFAARFGFAVAEDTAALMRHMVDTGEVDHLVAERVWQEISRGLMEARPSVMFDVLAACGALARIAPEWAAAVDSRHAAARDTLAALDRAAFQDAPLALRFALVSHRLGAAIEPLCERLRVPTDCRDLSVVCSANATTIRAAASLSPEQAVELFYRADAFRRKQRFDLALWAVAVEDGETRDAYPPARRLRTALSLAAGIDTEAIARSAGRGDLIAAGIREARIEAVRKSFAE